VDQRSDGATDAVPFGNPVLMCIPGNAAQIRLPPGTTPADNVENVYEILSSGRV
jgi:hypothetical protein